MSEEKPQEQSERFLEQRGPDRDFEPLVALEKLRSLATASDGSETLPDRVPVERIEQMPELFQPRQLDERHISELRRAVRTSGELEPLTVMKVGTTTVLLDGHHRVEAYRLHKITTAVPVRFFQGSLEDAVLEAGRANSRAKLPMSTAQRQNYAWRLVKIGSYSKRQVREASGVSDGQVGNMRRVLKALGEEAYGCDRWIDALNLHNGREREPMSHAEMEEFLEAQANQYADRLSKQFGPKLTDNVTLAARALEIHFGRRLPDLVSELSLLAPADEEDEEDDF